MQVSLVRLHVSNTLRPFSPPDNRYFVMPSSPIRNHTNSSSKSILEGKAIEGQIARILVQACSTQCTNCTCQRQHNPLSEHLTSRVAQPIERTARVRGYTTQYTPGAPQPDTRLALVRAVHPNTLTALVRSAQTVKQTVRDVKGSTTQQANSPHRVCTTHKQTVPGDKGLPNPKRHDGQRASQHGQ